MKKIYIVAVLILVELVWVLSASSTMIRNISIKPNPVIISATYHGTSLNVEGKLLKDMELIIKVIGQKKDTVFKRKGKVWGLLWMNTEDVVFKNLPGLYLVYAGNVKSPLLNKIGFDMLKTQVQVEPARDRDFLFRELLKLKQKEGLYAIKEKVISYKDVGDNIKAFSCRVSLPSKLKPGLYTVEILGIKENKIVERHTYELKAQLKGLPKLISFFAFQHGTIYGIAAVLIAIAAGLIIGSIFKGGGGH